MSTRIFPHCSKHHCRQKSATPLQVPVYAIYEKDGDNFKLKKERLDTNEYTLKDNNFSYKGSRRGPQSIALTSDYIVTVERDPKYDQTDGMKIGRDFNRLPKTLFLYDYDFQLKKIVNIDKPILWINAEPNENTVYLITIDPDFVILKYEL